MPVLDFESPIQIVGPGGVTRGARLTGLVDAEDPLYANLGHQETALAFQRWLQVQVATQEPLEFDIGHLVFMDGSRRAAAFTKRDAGAAPFVYAVTLERP